MSGYDKPVLSEEEQEAANEALAILRVLQITHWSAKTACELARIAEARLMTALGTCPQ